MRNATIDFAPWFLGDSVERENLEPHRPFIGGLQTSGNAALNQRECHELVHIHRFNFFIVPSWRSAERKSRRPIPGPRRSPRRQLQHTNDFGNARGTVGGAVGPARRYASRPLPHGPAGERCWASCRSAVKNEQAQTRGHPQVWACGPLKLCG